MLAHWYVAKTIKYTTAPLILALEIQRVFWTTWHDVFREK